MPELPEETDMKVAFEAESPASFDTLKFHEQNKTNKMKLFKKNCS